MVGDEATAANAINPMIASTSFDVSSIFCISRITSVKTKFLRVTPHISV